MTIGPPLNAPHGAPPAELPLPPNGPSAPPPYYAPARRRGLRGIAAAVVATTAALLVGGAVGYGVGSHKSSAPAARPASAAPAAPAPPPPPAALSPEAAQAKTCAVLKADYQGVANAIEAVNKFDNAPWSDPGLLSAVNTFVTRGLGLADKLEASLSPATPAEVRTAIVEYVAGLRATAISERNHASDKQVGGTARFYNQVLDAPLRICGISR